MTALAKLPEKWRERAAQIGMRNEFSSGQSHAYELCAMQLEDAISPAELGGVELTTSFIQEVPDRCDRIIWRGHYYHLPVNSASTPRADEAVVDDAMVELIEATSAYRGHIKALQSGRQVAFSIMDEAASRVDAALTAAISPPSPGAAK